MTKTASDLTRNGRQKLIKKLTRQRREAERQHRIYSALTTGNGFKALLALLK
jgi:hypothetical protein